MVGDWTSLKNYGWQGTDNKHSPNYDDSTTTLLHIVEKMYGTPPFPHIMLAKFMSPLYINIYQENVGLLSLFLLIVPLYKLM